MAEKPLAARLGDDLEIVGTPDVVTIKGIGDLKTGRPWTSFRADRSRQLSVYGLLYKAKFGKYPQKVWIDSLGRQGQGRSEWVFRRYWSHRTKEDYLAIVEILKRAREGIKKQIFLPASEDSWFCSPRWCVHYHYCKAVIGGRKAEV
jgi:hypothetical protein